MTLSVASVLRRRSLVDPKKVLDFSIEIEVTVRRNSAYGACHYHLKRDKVKGSTFGHTTTAVQRIVAEALLIAIQQMEIDENAQSKNEEA